MILRPNGRGREQGLSLLELVVVFLILSLLVGLASVSLRSTTAREGPRGMAHNLMADLRAARAEATRSGQLVAFCFPSEGKTNSFSRHGILRRGAQTGSVLKVLSYDAAYAGYIFVGRWPGAERQAVRPPVGWDTATADEMCLYFRPDGTAFSRDIPALDGNYPILVGSSFTFSGGGPDGTVSGVTDPHTIWVSGSGNIELEEGRVPGGAALPPVGVEPTVARLKVTGKTPSNPPKIEDITFLPAGIPGSDTVGLNQNYVQIHADQKESEVLEYGIATMEIVASDPDGGPLYFDLHAVASSGKESGNFTVSNETGVLDYIYDEENHRGEWRALVSWRPPPGAVEDTVYELQVTVRDEQGNSDFAVSGAGLLPRVASLPPSRMVLQTGDGELHLANIEGANTVKISIDGEPEYEPFFSPDGTRIYSKHRTPEGGLQFRVRNADGTGLKVLREFPPAVVAANSNNGDIEIWFDPTHEYAAYRFNVRQGHYPYRQPKRIERDDDDFYWILEDFVKTDDTIFHLEVMHLNSGARPVRVTDQATGKFYWDARKKHTLRFDEFRPFKAPKDLKPPTSEQAPFIKAYLPGPGRAHLQHQGVTLSGFPPKMERLNQTNPQPGLDARPLLFNPPDPTWYLDPTSSLTLGNLNGETYPLTSKPLKSKPSWSADGRFAAYVETGGELVVQEVLTSNFEKKSSFTTRYRYEDPQLSAATVSPRGRWVFFLSDGVLYRSVNASGSDPTPVATSLRKKIAAFAVSG